MLKVSLILGRFDELPGGDEAQAIDLARMADDAGLYGLTLGDHLVLGNRLDRYPYGTGWRHPDGAGAHFLEPAVVLGAFAAATTNIRLSTCVLLAPLRPAALLAKQLATIDVLSNGRCEPSLGYGWQPEEFAALGIDFEARRRIFRDTIACCRALWGEQPVSFSSETVSFEDLYAMPRPVQERIPILLGVKPTDRNVALIAELCDGWDPVSTITPEELRDGTARLRRAFVDARRDPDDLIVRAHLVPVRDDNGWIDLDRSFEGAGAALDCGANQIALQLPAGYGTVLDSMSELERFLTDVAGIAATY